MKWGVFSYNLYRSLYDIELTRDKLRQLDFFKSGPEGRRFGIDPRSIEIYDNIYTFNLCWDTTINIYVAERGKIEPRLNSAVTVKNVIVFGKYILVQSTEDDEKIKGFIFNLLSNKKILPVLLDFDENLLERVEKSAKKIREMMIRQVRDGRAEKVKLFNTSVDLRKTEDFREYMNRERTELKIIYGEKENDWIKIKKGSPGILVLSLPSKDKRYKLFLLKSFIDDMIEPNIHFKAIQHTLGW